MSYDPDDADDGTATLGRIRLTDDQRLMLVVLAEAALRDGMHRMSDLPSAATAAGRLGWTRKKFEKKIDNVCDRLARLDVHGMKGDIEFSQAVSRRVRLVEYASGASARHGRRPGVARCGRRRTGCTVIRRPGDANRSWS